MLLPDCLQHVHPSNTFAGIPIAQTFNDLTLWEHVINTAAPTAIVEFGTAEGGMALFLAVQALARNCRFITVDKYDALHANRYILENLDSEIINLDLFKTEGINYMSTLLLSLSRPLLLFCDNGNKKDEVRIYSEHLRRNDLLAVHDWGTEISSADIPPHFQLLFKREAECLNSMTRFFVCT